MNDVIEQLRTVIYNPKKEVTVKYDTLRDTIDLIMDLIEERRKLECRIKELEYRVESLKGE